MGEILPLLLLLACPLMMLFMMYSHWGHGRRARVSHQGSRFATEDLRARNEELEARIAQLEERLDEVQGSSAEPSLAPAGRVLPDAHGQELTGAIYAR